MKTKSLVLFAVAIGLGLFAMLGVKRVMSQNHAEEQYAKVLVAVADIPPGVPLDETNVTFRRWPLEAVPEGAVTTEEQYVERAVRGFTVAGEVIMQSKLGEKGVFGASSEIPVGMRAVTVSVDPTKTHSGQIQPGDRVDVLVTYKTRSDKGMISCTKTVLEFIKVFSVDSRRAAAAGEPQEVIAKNISLLVDPDQANLLMLAENKGLLHLALRHKTDDEPSKAAAVDDSFFDDIDTQLGKRDIEDEVNEVEAPNPDSIAEALQNELAGQGTSPEQPSDTAPVEPPPVAEKPPTWTVEIYFAGGNKGKNEPTIQKYEFEIPEEKEETDQERAKVSDLWKTIQEVVLQKSL